MTKLTYSSDGDVIVIAAKNPFTKVADDFCLPNHPDFLTWSSNLKSQGYELVESTITETLESIKKSPEKMQ